MATTVKAVYENGVFKPKEPVRLEEHAEVEVLLPGSKPRRDPHDPSGWKGIERLIGIADNAPPDLSENHDVYVYGKPPR